MKCKKCGTENPDGAKFCASCGSKLEANICPKCGTANAEEARFCASCGASLAKEEVFEAEPQFESNEQQARKKCRICGYENPADEKYCKACGSQLVDDIREGSGYQSNTSQTVYRQTSNEGGPGFVIGIVSIVCSITCCLFIVGLIGGIVGIVLNGLALKRQSYNRSKVIAGLVCSIIALAIGLILLIDIVSALNNPEFWEQYNEMLQQIQNGTYGN